MSDRPDVFETNTIGKRLKAAREAKGLTLDDVANTTRVPIRHLEHIERSDWDALPAPTYSVGFARAYASVVGLNAAELGAELRAELGGGKLPATAAPFYEPADPARVPPRSLAIVLGVLGALLIVGYLVWRGGSVDDTAVETEEVAAVDAPLVAPPPSQPLAPVAAAATGPVVLAATDEVWLRVTDAEGGASLHEALMRTGERYQVPATARRPQLTTGRPNALQVTVGNTRIPPLGPAETTVSDVSLLPADLVGRLQPGAAAPAGGAAQQPPIR